MVEGVSESTRREYAARMNRVVDHVQAHLTEPLDLERLAAVACFSPFHFHRLFSAWMGETLQSFVHRLRLERAAQLLVFHRLRSISDIAVECGFSSASAFARAFKAGYGVPAGEWRNRKICQTNSKPCEAETPASLGFSKLPGHPARHQEHPMTNTTLHVQVRRLAPLTIAYLRHIGAYKGDTELFRRLFTKLFTWAGPRGLMPPDFRYLSLFQDNPNLTPAARQRLEVALVVPAGTAPSGEIGVRTLEGGLYATAQVRVQLQDYAAQWDALVADWLPASGYQPDHRPAMEFYLNNPDTDPEGRYHIEMCLPLRPL
ncbi:AraC family transcriptional regulator [Paludibaculum fermentans]|uniref:AraC family transcriptional regulator n=1 Tax=Paludibaculum fermentans TaxID=1473598 RepID=UPI003EBA6058